MAAGLPTVLWKERKDRFGREWATSPLRQLAPARAPCFPVAQMVADAFAGEREPKTLPDRAILAGKLAAAPEPGCW